MGKVQSIINELDQLNAEDLELVLSEIKRRLNRKKRAESLLNEYVGKGKGIWGGRCSGIR